MDALEGGRLRAVMLRAVLSLLLIAAAPRAAHGQPQIGPPVTGCHATNCGDAENRGCAAGQYYDQSHVSNYISFGNCYSCAAGQYQPTDWSRPHRMYKYDGRVYINLPQELDANHQGWSPSSARPHVSVPCCA